MPAVSHDGNTYQPHYHRICDGLFLIVSFHPTKIIPWIRKGVGSNKMDVCRCCVGSGDPSCILYIEMIANFALQHIRSNPNVSIIRLCLQCRVNDNLGGEIMWPSYRAQVGGTCPRSWGGRGSGRRIKVALSVFMWHGLSCLQFPKTPEY